MYPHPYGGYASGAAALTQALICPIPGMAAFYRRCSDRVTQLSFAMHTVKTKFPAAAGRSYPAEHKKRKTLPIL